MKLQTPDTQMRITQLLFKLYIERFNFSNRRRISKDLDDIFEGECYYLFFKKIPSKNPKKTDSPKISPLKSLETILFMHLNLIITYDDSSEYFSWRDHSLDPNNKVRLAIQGLKLKNFAIECRKLIDGEVDNEVLELLLDTAFIKLRETIQDIHPDSTETPSPLLK
jgi:hypothetical protein